MTSMVNYETLRRLAVEVGEETLPSLFVVFTDELCRYLTELSDMPDITKVRDICHALKSSAASFGADELAELARECEYRVKLDQSEWVIAQLPHLIELLNLTIRDYKKLALGEQLFDSIG